jgi:YidC/Oxa1 family membrane protein insertase
VLNYGVAAGKDYGVMTTEQALQAKASSIFGVPIYATFTGADLTPNPLNTHVLTAILIVLMTATTFLTQRQLIVKNTARDNPIAQQQKILLYVFPFFFMVTGINFPVGVLLYWLTTNLWSMGQQFYVIRNNPQPDTPAYAAWEEREAAKRRRKNDGVDPEEVKPVIAPPAPRQQPKNQPRSKRKGGASPTTPASDDSGTPSSDGTDPDPQT